MALRPLEIEEPPLAVEDPRVSNGEMWLAGHRPNPVTASATIRLELPSEATVRLEVLDVRGRLVRRLHDGRLGSGSHDIVWTMTGSEGQRVAPGVYYYRLNAGARHETRRMIVIR